MREIEVHHGDWRDFPGEEKDKVAEVMSKLEARGETDGLMIMNIDPVSIPEVLVHVRDKYSDKLTCIVSNFGSCACGKCDPDGVFYAFAVASTKDDAQQIIDAEAEKHGMVSADSTEGLRSVIGTAMMQKIVESIAEKHGIDPSEIKIREMSMDEVGALGINLGDDDDQPKRTVH